MLAAKQILQNAQTTGNGNALDLRPAGMSVDLMISIIGSAGVATGAVQVEEADDPAYAGTWAPIGGPVTVLASQIQTVRASGGFRAIRARISTNVTGGTVTVNATATNDE